MTKLSVNINKFATLRNSRGGNNPNVQKTAQDCERFGADGITVHPRPDERHITYEDVFAIKEVVTTEYNIEGYPDQRYMEIIRKAQPEQATIVPDKPGDLTSNAGWDTVKNEEFLTDIVKELKSYGTRVSIFVSTEIAHIEGAAKIGADRIELYTEPYASQFKEDSQTAVESYKIAAEAAKKLGLGINAGHDLDLQNLNFLSKELVQLDEVSIGHALVCDALYFGLENVIPMYKAKLQ